MAGIPPDSGQLDQTLRIHAIGPIRSIASELPELHAVIGGDDFGRPFADHDHNCIDVAAGDFGHHAGVRHAQVPDPIHPQDPKESPGFFIGCVHCLRLSITDRTMVASSKNEILTRKYHESSFDTR